MKLPQALMFLSAIALAGCASNAPSTPEVFSQEWAEEAKPDRPRQKKEDVVLIEGASGKAAYITRDSKGRPRLAFGEKGRVSAGVSGENVGLQYELPIGERRKKVPEERDSKADR
jgi:hypothetical protein